MPAEAFKLLPTRGSGGGGHVRSSIYAVADDARLGCCKGDVRNSSSLVGATGKISVLDFAVLTV